MINIDQRLKTIAELVKKTDSYVADIGTDHAYLPIYLVQAKRASYVYATDINKGPLFNAKKDIARYNLKTQIETRLGTGLQPILDVEKLDTIIISGMGGKLISQIMKDATHLNEGVDYIFGPNASENVLRKWLCDNNFIINDEKIIKDQKRIYEFITARKCKSSAKLSNADIMLGPFLRREKNSIFIEKWTREMKKRLLIQENRKKANNPNFSNDLMDEIKIIEEIYE